MRDDVRSLLFREPSCPRAAPSTDVRARLRQEEGDAILLRMLLSCRPRLGPGGAAMTPRPRASAHAPLGLLTSR